ncbi:hypothetical protein BGX28_002533 [Mortierella sp. GBA30]|nr:hypothetical protein BGX28_002533 [Mortierella sp. GBA30]
MEKAVSLPEILGGFGDYLDNKDLLNCIRVCKLWKLTFATMLWRSFIIRTTTNRDGDGSRIMVPSYDLMERNARYIRLLILEDVDVTHRAFFCRCYHVEKLVLAIEAPSTSVELAYKRALLDDIVKNFPNLRNIVIHGEKITPNPSFYKTLLECPHLVALETTGRLFLGDAATELYLRASSTNMKRLSSCLDYFSSGFVFPDDLKFPELRSLNIKHAEGMPLRTHRCPKLRSLSWNPFDVKSAVQFRQIVPAACPNITSLSLSIIMDDDEIESIINAMPRIEELRVPNARFAALSMNALRRHFSWLTSVSFRDYDSVTSVMVQEILCSCPVLKSIAAQELHYRDIIANPQPWACQSLHVLEITITVIGAMDDQTITQINQQQQDKDATERLSFAHKYIYDRLAQLTSLQYLGLCAAGVDMSDEDVFKINLESGLAALATLKRLSQFSYQYLFGILTVQEVIETVEWMVEHWTGLNILGNFNGHSPRFGPRVDDNADMNRTLKLLKDRGIAYM